MIGRLVGVAAVLAVAAGAVSAGPRLPSDVPAPELSAAERTRLLDEAAEVRADPNSLPQEYLTLAAAEPHLTLARGGECPLSLPGAGPVHHAEGRNGWAHCVYSADPAVQILVVPARAPLPQPYADYARHYSALATGMRRAGSLPLPRPDWSSGASVLTAAVPSPGPATPQVSAMGVAGGFGYRVRRTLAVVPAGRWTLWISMESSTGAALPADPTVRVLLPQLG